MTDNEIKQWYRDTTNKSWIYPENSGIISRCLDEDDDEEDGQLDVIKCNSCMHLHTCYIELQKEHRSLTLEELKEEKICEDYISMEEFVGS